MVSQFIIYFIFISFKKSKIIKLKLRLKYLYNLLIKMLENDILENDLCYNIFIKNRY